MGWRRRRSRSGTVRGRGSPSQGLTRMSRSQTGRLATDYMDLLFLPRKIRVIRGWKSLLFVQEFDW